MWLPSTRGCLPQGVVGRRKPRPHMALPERMFRYLQTPRLVLRDFTGRHEVYLTTSQLPVGPIPWARQNGALPERLVSA